MQIDGKVFVEDIWDVKDINYSTLYQSYEGLNKEDFSDVRVSYFDENIQSWKYMRENEYIPYNGKEELYHFHADMYGGQFEIAWGVGFENSRGSGKYRLEYTVNNITYNYLDTAEYYHMFVGKSFGFPIKDFKALISFPAPLTSDDSYIWGHGAPSGEIRFQEGQVAVLANNIKANTFIEARVLFPKELVYLAPEINENVKNSILREEQINTENTTIAKINNLNRNRIMSVAKAVILMILGIIITYEIFQILKIRQKFSTKEVRRWARYTDLPQTKLNIAAANIIYEKKGFMNFFTAVLMKLSHHKYLEIENIRENIKNSLDNIDDNLMNKVKIVEKLCAEKGISASPLEIAKVFVEKEKEIRREKAKELHINASNLSNIRYKLNIKVVEEAIEQNLLDDDEKQVISFLKSISSTAGYMYSSNLKRAISKTKSNISIAIFEEAQKRFEENLTLEQGIMYIEQHQVISKLISENYEGRYQGLLYSEEKKLDSAGIYSKEKEEKAEKILPRNFGEIIILVLMVASLLYFLVGTILFNEQEYINMASFTLIFSLVITVIHLIKYNSLTPHLTIEGLNIREEYKGLYNFLNNDSFIREYPEESIIIWGEYLVLATYFGIADKVLKTLRAIRPQVISELEANNFSISQMNYLWAMSNIINTSMRNTAFANIASTALNVAVSSMSGSSGSGGSSGGGGGFTSGGGGGRGGGGGGGR